MKLCFGAFDRSLNIDLPDRDFRFDLFGHPYHDIVHNGLDRSFEEYDGFPRLLLAGYDGFLNSCCSESGFHIRIAFCVHFEACCGSSGGWANIFHSVDGPSEFFQDECG